MQDINDLLNRFSADADTAKTLHMIQQALHSPQGQQLVHSLSVQNKALLEQAAASLQCGDRDAAIQLASRIMQTPEGAKIAAQIRKTQS